MEPPHPSSAHRAYVLGLLFVVYAFNFMDRSIFYVLIPPIKEELALSDTQLGLVGGIAFALFYVTVGLPIARLADRSSRVNIISVALAIWSAMTVLTGLAASFVQLLLARVGVGVGEAGCSPPAQSIISDVYPPEQRATAIGLYSAGSPIGSAVGLAVGGLIASVYGWRAALFAVGVPGLILALVVRTTLSEPPRGMVEKREATGEESSIWEVIRLLWSRRSFRHMSLGASMSAFIGYGSSAWTPSFLARSHEMDLANIGYFLGAVSLIGGTLAISTGGRVADLMARRDRAWWMWVPGAGMLIGVPFAVMAYLVDTTWLALVGLFIMGATASPYPGPVYACVQGLVGLRQRAVAIAFVLFIINFIGLGLGPFLVGAVSDLMNQAFGNESLRYSLLSFLIFKLWSSVHFYWAGRYVAGDLDRAPA